jgi:hypothetical protein
MHHDGSIGRETTSSVVWIAEAGRVSRHLDMQYCARLDPGVEVGGTDARQPAAHSPRPDDVAPLCRSRVPAIPDPHQVASVPCGDVDLVGAHPTGTEFVPAGQTLMAVDDLQEVFHAGTLPRRWAALHRLSEEVASSAALCM